MLTLIKIRFCQIKYELKHLGIAHNLFLIVLFAIAEMVLYSAFSKYPLYVSLGILLIVFSAHLSRKDAVFIKMNVENPQLALFLDYLSLSILFISPVLLTPNWYCFFPILMGIYLISFVETQSNFKPLELRFLSRFIPVSMFEILSGSRKNYVILGLISIYVAAFALAWVRGLPLFLLWILTTFICSFFNEYEPLNLLRKDEQLNSTLFLEKKLRRFILPLIVAFLPILVINSAFHTDIWWINPIFLVVQILTLSLSVLYKYATYHPKAYFNGNSPVLIIAGLCIVLPFFIPLILFFNLRYYPKALRNLNRFL
jgi:hypothetical protein